jgi:branched-chain amino acid transport system permease protein
MLGAYIGYTLTERRSGVVDFWSAIVLAAIGAAAIGVLVEMLLLRRVYEAPELFQLLATFGVTLVISDLVLLIWGPSELLGPRAPGFKGAIDIFGHPFPTYDLLLIALAPLVLAFIWLIFRRTTWGVLVRAATQDREMVAALGVNQKWLFTSVFALGVFLAGLGGALELPRQAASHTMDLQVIVEALVVVVIGGLGSVPSTFLAAIIVSELCRWRFSLAIRAAGRRWVGRLATTSPKREGLSLFVSEQNLVFARLVAERVYVIEKGAIRFGGTMAEFDARSDVRDAYLAF